MFQVQQLLVILFLVVNGIYDMKHKKIWGKSIGIFVIVLIICIWLGKEFCIEQRLIAWLPGVLLFIVSIIIPGVIGMGDSICLLYMGCVWNFQEMLRICCYAFLLAGLCGVLLLCTKKAARDTRIPFVPFLLLGTLLQTMKG